MARNRKPANLKKLSQIQTTNGFRIDLANYMYNPSYDHEYPNLLKLTHETTTERFYTNIKYFKRYNGTGYYTLETYSHKIDDSNSWSIANSLKEVELEESNRFNMKHLIELAEQIKLDNILAMAEAAK